VPPPLLKASIDALEEAIDQSRKGTDKGNKFCVLFCDQAAELILKEKLRSVGVSIYIKTGPRTRDFHEILDILENQKGVKIPEHVNLEMVHDLRNNIQHRGAAVLKSETDFFIKTTSDFMKRFLKDELKWKLRDIVHPQYYKLLELDITKATQPIKITSHGAIKLYKIEEAPSVMLLEYRNIETELNRLAKKLSLQQQLPKKHRLLITSDIVNILISNGTLPREAKDDFDTISMLRNKVAHVQKQVTMEEFEKFILAMIRFKGRIEIID
jgi:uncharacterized protein YutE (UPF0331/DUF86 family)